MGLRFVVYFLSGDNLIDWLMAHSDNHYILPYHVSIFALIMRLYLNEIKWVYAAKCPQTWSMLNVRDTDGWKHDSD